MPNLKCISLFCAIAFRNNSEVGISCTNETECFCYIAWFGENTTTNNSIQTLSLFPFRHLLNNQVSLDHVRENAVALTT